MSQSLQFVEGLKLYEVIISSTQSKEFIVSPKLTHGAIFQEIAVKKWSA